MATSIEDRSSTSPPSLTRDSPLRERFAAWAVTRFPPAVWMVLSVMFLDAALIGSRAAGHQPVALAPEDLAGLVAFVLFFLGIRVYDEHKDYESDRVHHTDRLTVTGVMPLSDLRRINAVALALQAAICIWIDRGLGPVVGTWLITVAWSLLMLKEFFVSRWLQSHPVLYSVSHAGVMPLAIVWAVTIGARRLVSDPAVWWLCGLTVVSAFLLELCRKLRGPNDEEPGVESYT
jgi:4-hydroxybenzoate polyprenyltransferase